MTELKSYKTRTFKSGKWIIDIVEKKDEFESWLCVENYGEKSFMFGSSKKQHELDGTEYIIDFDYFRELVVENLPEYKRIFRLEHIEVD